MPIIVDGGSGGRGTLPPAFLHLALLCAASACVVALMCRHGTLDHPVARSSHTRPTPKGGGVGIAACFALGMLTAPHPLRGDTVLTAACLTLAAASYLDDVRNWPFWPKLAAQLAAAAAVLAAGFASATIAWPGGIPVPLGLLAVPAAMVWLLFTVNAVNFMDGLNGLAAGCCGLACLVLACAAPAAETWPEQAIAAGIAGFLPFNYPRARIFMGDVGSQFLGLAVAALALRHAGEAAYAWVLPLGLSPLLADAAFTLCRRLAAREKLTEAHRGHLYQIAQRAGMAAWAVTSVYWALSLWAAWCGARWGVSGNPLWCAAALLPLPGWAIYAVARARVARLVW